MYNKEFLKRIFDRTSGYCHICKKKLSFKNYAKTEGRGTWEVEHSRPQSKGGSNHLNNLYASCITCNRSKGAHTTQTARAWHNRTKAPLSKEQRENAKRTNAFWGAFLLGVLGSITAGPLGVARGVCILVGVAVGGKFGYACNPDE